MSVNRMILLLIFGLLVAPADGHAVPANLLDNAGFETGDVSIWTVDAVDSLFGVFGIAQVVHTGTYGAFIEGPVHNEAGLSGSFSQGVVLPSPGTYAFGAWLRFFVIGDAVGNTDAGQVSMSLGGALSTEGTTPANVGSANFVPAPSPPFGANVFMSDWILFSGLFAYTGPGGETAQFTISLLNGDSGRAALALDDVFVAAVPVPPAFVLMVTGLIGVGLARRTRPRSRGARCSLAG
ncbi:MAG: hypothetical protein WD036_02150 [Bauldia sp.]